MPSASYRRKLRNKAVSAPIAVPIYLVSSTDYGIQDCSESELNQIRQTFYRILDMITKHENFTEIIALIQSIITRMATRVEYYEVLDIIEHKLISVVENISDSVSPSIILARIEYIKTVIEKLEPDCAELGPVSKLILEILDYIIGTVSFEPVRSKLSYIQTYIAEKYGSGEELCKIRTVQDTLLDIICNIGEAAPLGIIGERIEYVRLLIDKL